MYVLIQTDGGRARAVAALARELPGIAEVEVVWGPYDVVARVEAASPQDVLETLKGLPHVHRALPCPITSRGRADRPRTPGNAATREAR